MKQEIIMSDTSIDTSEDSKRKTSKRKTHVTPLLLAGFHSPFQGLFLNYKGGLVPAKSAMRVQDANTPSTPITEKIKPWMAYTPPDSFFGYAGKHVEGIAGDYGLQKIWSEGINGQGVKVGVSDTGLVRGHADFDYSRIDSSGYEEKFESEVRPGGNARP